MVNVHAHPPAPADRRSTLVFAVSVAHVVSLTNAFRERGVDARFVYEGTKQKERDELYCAFKAGEFAVLVNCGILTEGGASLSHSLRPLSEPSANSLAFTPVQPTFLQSTASSSRVRRARRTSSSK